MDVAPILDLDQTLEPPMTYLLIIFIIALALAPLAHFVPSKHQRRIAKLREFAAISGMFVEYRPLPEGALSAAEAAPFQRGKTIYYGVRIPATARGVRENKAWVLGTEGWRSLPRGGDVPAEFQSLSPRVFAASMDQESCGIYWNEQGDENEISIINQLVSELMERVYS